MKRFFIAAVFALLILGTGLTNAAFADSSDTWNVTVKTGPDTRTIVPLNSTGVLSLENFTVSSQAQISSVAYDASISELSFTAVVTGAEGTVQGTNIQVAVPSDVYNNQSLVINNRIDGKNNGYTTLGSSGDSTILGWFLSAGSHTVTVDIGVDPPPVPEFSVLMLTLFLFLTLFSLGLMKRKTRTKHARQTTERAPQKPPNHICRC
jgi:hypothetical protein